VIIRTPGIAWTKVLPGVKPVEQMLTKHLKLFQDALKANQDLELMANITQSIAQVRP
jgi:hypothetical protein